MFTLLVITFFSSIIGLRYIFEFVLLKPVYIIYLLLVFLLDIGLFNFLYELCEKQIFKHKDRIIK